MELPYQNRVEAGRVLAAALKSCAGRRDLLVLALPRGGVPVAAVIAEALAAELDLMLVRKLGLPRHPELAMGAIASGGIRVLNEDLIAKRRIPGDIIERVTMQEQNELQRRLRLYRGDRSEPVIAGREIILVDDGLATGATMRAAVAALRRGNPVSIIVAVPVAPPDTVAELGQEVDNIVCPATPPSFFGVSRWYQDFSQTEDAEVKSLLSRAWKARPIDVQQGYALTFERANSAPVP